MSILTLSQEGLYDFRSPLLAGNILDAVKLARERKAAGEPWKPKMKTTLEKLIRTQFGVNLIVNWSEEPLGLSSPACMTYTLITDHNLKLDEVRRYSDSEHATGAGVRAVDAVYRGWYDESKHKVGGFFAKLPAMVTLNEHIIDFEDDVTGILLLHEVGHYLDYVWTVANQYRHLGVVESLVRGIRGSKNAVTAAKFVTDTMGEFGVTIEHPEDLKTARNDDTIRSMLLYAWQDVLPAMMQNEQKTLYRGEMIADDLSAAVYGPRRAAEALAQFEAMLEHGNLLKTSAIVVGCQAIGVALFGLVYLGAAMVIIGFFAVAMSATRVSMTHPRMDDRVRHLRNLLLSEAKKPRLSREELITLTDGIASLDRIIKQYDTVASAISDRLARWIFDFHKAQLSVHDLDMAYEELAMNPLFLRAQQLNQLKDR